MLTYSLSVLLLLQSIAAVVIDACTIPHPSGSTINLLVQYHQDLVNQLTIDPDYTIMLIKMEEDKHSDIKKVVFQVTDASFKMYYLGIGYEVKEEKIHYETVIQSSKIDVVSSVLGFKKYDQSVTCKNFRHEAKKEFEAMWSKISHQLKETKTEENTHTHGHVLNQDHIKTNDLIDEAKTKVAHHQQNHSADKTRTEATQPTQLINNSTALAEQKLNAENSTSSNNSLYPNDTAKNSTKVTVFKVSSIPVALNVTNHSDVLSVTHNSTGSNVGKSETGHSRHGFKLTEAFNFTKSDDKKPDQPKENALFKTLNETSSSNQETSSDTSNAKNKTLIVKFLAKTFGPLMDFENVIYQTTEKSISFSDSKHSESETGDSSSVIKAPEELKSAFSKHGFDKSNSFTQTDFSNKHSFSGFGNMGFSGTNLFSSNGKLSNGNSFGDFGKLSGFGSTRSLSRKPENHRSSSRKEKLNDDNFSSDEDSSRKAKSHRIHASSSTAHGHRDEHGDRHGLQTSVNSANGHSPMHPAHHAK